MAAHVPQRAGVGGVTPGTSPGPYGEWWTRPEWQNRRGQLLKSMALTYRRPDAVNAVANDTGRSGPDERIVAALLGEGPAEGCRPRARAAPAGGNRRQPARPCWRGWAWCPSATTPKPAPTCSTCRWSASRTAPEAAARRRGAVAALHEAVPRLPGGRRATRRRRADGRPAGRLRARRRAAGDRPRRAPERRRCARRSTT